MDSLGLVQYTPKNIEAIYCKNIKSSFNFEVMSEMLPSKQLDFESRERGNITKQTQFCGSKDWGESGDINSFCSDLGYYQDNTTEEGLLFSKCQRDQQVQLFSVFGSLDDLYSDILSPPFQSCQEDITKLANIQSENTELVEAQKEKPYTFPVASLGILKNYRRRSIRFNGEKINVLSYETACTKVSGSGSASGKKLSTHAKIRLAGESFIEFCSQRVDDLSVLSHPFAKSFSGLSDDDTRDVELVEYLLASAEKVGQKLFDSASKLLGQCDKLSSNKGNPVQRLVYYFAEALRQKIDRETGRTTSEGLGKKQSSDLEEAMMSPRPANIAFHRDVPFSQVSQFTGMQAIVENVAEAKKVHIIDFVIMNGSQCTVLMQALADRCEPIEHLKITAIGTKSKSKSNMEETGKRLMKFAESMKLSFSFSVVMIADMLDLNEDLFEVDAEEAVAVCSSYLLWTMLAQPDRLECMMKVIRNIKPCVMVVTEVEASHNSPVFVNRFIEALFFYSALFDSMEDCMGHDEPNRRISESTYFSLGIQSIVAAEGKERTTRHVSINVWRSFFARFGMVEIELSMSSLYQANLVVKKFACGSSCTLDMDGKCLIIGWKGTPLHSVSAWKFE